MRLRVECNSYCSLGIRFLALLPPRAPSKNIRFFKKKYQKTSNAGFFLANLKLKNPKTAGVKLARRFSFLIALITIGFIVDLLKTLAALKKAV